MAKRFKKQKSQLTVNKMRPEVPPATNEPAQNSALAAPYSEETEPNDENFEPGSDNKQSRKSLRRLHSRKSSGVLSEKSLSPLAGSAGSSSAQPSPVSSHASLDTCEDHKIRKLNSKRSFQVKRAVSQNTPSKGADREPSSEREPAMSLRRVSSNLNNIANRGVEGFKELMPAMPIMPTTRKGKKRVELELRRAAEEERGRQLQRAQRPAQILPRTNSGSPTEMPNLGHVRVLHYFHVTNPDRVSEDDELLGYFTPGTGVSTTVTPPTKQQVATEAAAAKLSLEGAQFIEGKSDNELAAHFMSKKIKISKKVEFKDHGKGSWEKDAAARMFGGPPTKATKPAPVRRTVPVAQEARARQPSIDEVLASFSASSRIPTHVHPEIPKALQAGVCLEAPGRHSSQSPEGQSNYSTERLLAGGQNISLPERQRLHVPEGESIHSSERQNLQSSENMSIQAGFEAPTPRQLALGEEEELDAGRYAQRNFSEQPLGTGEGAMKRIEMMEQAARRRKDAEQYGAEQYEA